MKILLIDDDRSLCKVLSYQLEKHGHSVTVRYTGEEGLEAFSEADFDLVLSDIQLPDVNGIAVLKRIRKLDQQVVIILITAYGTVNNAVEACRLGADDYITKPFGQEQLLFVIEKAIRLRNLQQENLELREELSEKFRFENMVVHSPAMANLAQTAAKVARSNATVLIQGESGTGKELLARAIHYNSPRKDKPFITVNCPSIPDHLLESELFGHVRGAFTGAVKDRKGKFELADGGTIFLDEVGDLRGDLQAKLLRVLQQREFERLGENRSIHVDVRMLAASNKNLKELTEQGKFREDLYYRLSVVPLTIPPLRERKEEIPYLVDFFLKRYGDAKAFKLDHEIYKILENYDWPGNVRELENVIERATVLSTGNRLTKNNLPSHIVRDEEHSKLPDKQIFSEDLALDSIEKRAISVALKKTDGNKSEAARLLKIPRHKLLYRMKKLNID